MTKEEIQRIADILRTWAIKKPLINRIFLYGSRIAGNNKPESDLDIAIELDSKEFRDKDKSDGDATWIEVSDDWKEELEAIINCEVDLEKLDSNTPTVRAGIKKSGVLVFDKTKGPCQPSS